MPYKIEQGQDFKPGEWVECVDNSADEKRLTVGKLYLVLGPERENSSINVEIGGARYGRFRCRFRRPVLASTVLDDQEYHDIVAGQEIYQDLVK